MRHKAIGTLWCFDRYGSTKWIYVIGRREDGSGVYLLYDEGNFFTNHVYSSNLTQLYRSLTASWQQVTGEPQ